MMVKTLSGIVGWSNHGPANQMRWASNRSTFPLKAFQILTVSGATIVEPCEVEKPEPGAGEIGLRIHAAGLNRGEFIVGGVMHGAAGKPGGTEAAGEVTSIGQGVTD